VGPRDDNFKDQATKSVNDAIVFPSLLPPGRFSHLSLSVGSSVYVLGGRDLHSSTFQFNFSAFCGVGLD
jgi:hypothetical protein